MVLSLLLLGDQRDELEIASLPLLLSILLSLNSTPSGVIAGLYCSRRSATRDSVGGAGVTL